VNIKDCLWTDTGNTKSTTIPLMLTQVNTVKKKRFQCIG